ncbi:Protein GRAVITROPIC IN THE LIGHT 1 [Linum grandiflorum]
MLAEIQEQPSLMKTYQITIQKLEAEADSKSFDAESMKKLLDEYTDFNRSLEKKMNASGPLTMFDNIQLSALNPSHFVSCLHYTIRFMRSFAKLMIREMESAHCDRAETNRGFVFELFVSKTMFEGFNHLNFTVSNDSATEENDENNHRRMENCFGKFKKMKAVNLRHYLTKNPNSSFAKFTRGKYSQLVHAKMECSLFGNLNQRKAVTSGAFPETAFFGAFAEMARRVWVLNLLALSFGEQLHIF